MTVSRTSKCDTSSHTKDLESVIKIMTYTIKMKHLNLIMIKNYLLILQLLFFTVLHVYIQGTFI